MRLINDIKYVIVTMWTKGETGEDTGLTGLTWIARGIVVLAFLELSVACAELFALIGWIFP